MPADYTLYWEALSGAIAPEAMLEEMRLPYERVAIDMAVGEHRSPTYLAINPTGQVPALRLPDGTVVGESAAIVLVLGERHPEGGLAPGARDPERPAFLRWLMFMTASVYMTFVRANHPERFTTDGAGIDGVRSAALEAIDSQFGILDAAVAGDPFFLPRGFTALDIYLAMLTVWHPDRGALFDRHRRIGVLCDAVERRESYARVIARHRPR